MITEYLLKKSAYTKSLMAMSSNLKKLAVILATVVILLSVIREDLGLSFSSYLSRKIDIFTDKKPFDGKGINQSSDSFQPQELVFLYALVTYNEYPVANKLVAFQVNNPSNAFQNITMVHTSPTNQSGIAQFSFRIPWPEENAEQIIFGEWSAIATVDVAGEVIIDSLTFQVGWIVQVTDITTLNENLEPQREFQRGETVVFNLTVRNIALTAKLGTIIITVYDAAAYPITYIEKDNLVFQPGESHLSALFQIPISTIIGIATTTAGPYTASPKMGGLPYSPAVTSTFEIIASPKRRYYLIVKTDPQDIACIPGEGWYNENSVVSLTAPLYVSMSLGVRYKFLYWNVDGVLKPENPITITMDGNRTATAHYILQCHLTVQTDPAGIVTIPGEGWYDAFQNVTLTAPALSEYNFERWDVDGSYLAMGVKTITVFMDSPHTATAHYSSLHVGGWYLPEWFYWLLLLIWVIVIGLLALWFYRRRRRKEAKEAFQKGWTAWYYGYKLGGRPSSFGLK
ncbi:MAG: hypothetical protein QXX51_09135 [Candidatus Bathyarchaeia archaeon]